MLEADRESTGSGDESDELGTTLAGIHKVAQGGSKYWKLITTLKVEGKNIDFEVDTGAELSTIPAVLYRAKLKQVGLEPSSVILRQYDGTALPTVGEIVVGASHAWPTACLKAGSSLWRRLTRSYTLARAGLALPTLPRLAQDAQQGG